MVGWMTNIFRSTAARAEHSGSAHRTTGEMMNATRLQVVFLILLVLVAFTRATAAPTITSQPGITVTGTMDSQAFTCRGVSQYTLTFIPATSDFQIEFDCASAGTLVCDMQDVSIDVTLATTHCTTHPPVGALGVVHLPGLTTIPSGQSAYMLVQVYNNTGKAFTSMTVSSSSAPQCSAPSQPMANGAVVSYTCLSPPLTSDVDDTISVAAVASDGTHFSGSATSQIRVDGPRISLAVTPPRQIVGTNGTATWLVRVANAGPVQLTSGVFADQRASGCAASVTSIPSNTVLEYSCSLSGIAATFSDQFSASAMAGSQPVVADQTVWVLTDEIFRGTFE